MKKLNFDALCMESSRVKQIKDEIHYYVPQLKSVGFITIQTLTISNVIFKKYLCNCNVSYQVNFTAQHCCITDIASDRFDL